MSGENHITTVTSTTEGLAVFVLMLVVGAAVSLIAAHLADRGVNPIRDAVSDFGAREHPWYYRIAALWLGLAGLLTAVMLGDAMFPKPTGTILALLVFAAARWAITIFPTDLEGEEETSTGRSHLILAVVAFFMVALAAGLFAAAIGPDPFWDDRQGLFNLLALLVGVLAVFTGAARAAAPQVFGLVERLFYVSMFAWFSAVALTLLTG